MVGSRCTVMRNNAVLCHGQIADMVKNQAIIRVITPIQFLEQPVLIYEFTFSHEVFIYAADIVAYDSSTLTAMNMKLLSNSERRKSERFIINSQALMVSQSLGLDFTATIVDISQSGVQFASDYNLSLSDTVSLQLPMKIDSNLEILTANADIVRCGMHDNKFHYGCHFRELSERDDFTMRKFLERHQSNFFRKNIL